MGVGFERRRQGTLPCNQVKGSNRVVRIEAGQRNFAKNRGNWRPAPYHSRCIPPRNGQLAELPSRSKSKALGCSTQSPSKKVICDNFVRR